MGQWRTQAGVHQHQQQGGPGRGPAGRGQGRSLRPRPALRFIVNKHLLIYDVHVYQVFPVSSLEYDRKNDDE